VDEIIRDRLGQHERCDQTHDLVWSHRPHRPHPSRRVPNNALIRFFALSRRSATIFGLCA